MNLSDKTALVWDNELAIPIARRLARSFGRVLYTPAWVKAQPVLADGIIGDGFGDIEQCLNPWLVKNEVDVFIFPDLYHEGEQAELREQGFPVWGADAGMRLELDREFFLNKLEELGLDVPPYEIVTGCSDLAAYLRNKKDIFIKTSFWRGTWETYHWRSWKQDAHKLDLWRVKYGGAREEVQFLCFDKIETNLEIGGDTYCIDGNWPGLMLHGIEAKDEAYFGAVTKREDMPEQLTHIMEAFSPYLSETGYRCNWSMEVRVADAGDYFTDATTRLGLPSIGSQLLLWDNFPEIIWGGANGELVEPIPVADYSAECMVKIKPEKGAWDTIIVPDELKPFLMLLGCCEIDGQIWFPDDPKDEGEIGWLCAIGDTPTKVAEQMNLLADMLPDGATACVESLADIIREIEEEKGKGIKFGTDPMPKPEIVLQP